MFRLCQWLEQVGKGREKDAVEVRGAGLGGVEPGGAGIGGAEPGRGQRVRAENRFCFQKCQRPTTGTLLFFGVNIVVVDR